MIANKCFLLPFQGQNVNLDDDMKDAHKEAQASAGSSGNSELFSSVLGALSQKKPELADGKIDEQGAFLYITPTQRYFKIFVHLHISIYIYLSLSLSAAAAAANTSWAICRRRSKTRRSLQQR